VTVPALNKQEIQQIHQEVARHGIPHDDNHGRCAACLEPVDYGTIESHWTDVAITATLRLLERKRPDAWHNMMQSRPARTGN
jgi:hypothetical protein